jgi:hypothetical protein
MNNEHQENRALTGPLIFTMPASCFLVALNVDWLDGSDRTAISAKPLVSDYLATRPRNGKKSRVASLN